jgi:hypothetical protein
MMLNARNGFGWTGSCCGKRRGRPHRYAPFCLLLVTLSLNLPVSAADITEPAVACDLMRQHGLPGAGAPEQTAEGYFRCDSRRRSLPLGGEPSHEIRYFATGRAGRVESLNLQLTINTRQEVQAAYRRLLEYTNNMLEAALGVQAPAEMAAAILSGLSGGFQVDGKAATVGKAHTTGVVYEYIVSLRLDG